MAGQYISVDTQGGAYSAYVNAPAHGVADAVLVLQEIFGVTPFVTGVCDWLAAKGYAALAPDLFWRQQPGVVLAEDDRETAVRLMNGLDAALVMQDCESAIARLRRVTGGKVAALGYCLGGKFAYLLATRGAVDAAISYYGVGIQNALDAAATLSTPTLLHIAAEDPLCPPEAQSALAVALGAAPLPAAIEVHAGVGHAFARIGSPAFRADAARHADATTLDFLRTRLSDAAR